MCMYALKQISLWSGTVKVEANGVLRLVRAAASDD